MFYTIYVCSCSIITSWIFNLPLDARLDYQNSVYVADYRNHRIQKFTMSTSNNLLHLIHCNEE